MRIFLIPTLPESATLFDASRLM